MEPVIIIWVTWHILASNRESFVSHGVRNGRRRRGFFLGGTVGLLHNPQREEVERNGYFFTGKALGTPRLSPYFLLKITPCQALVGDEGQLATILDLVSCLSLPHWIFMTTCFVDFQVVQPDNSVIVFAQTCFLLEIFGTHGRWIKNQTPSFPFFCRYKRC